MKRFDPLDGMQDATRLVRRKADYSKADPVATPIFQASAFRAGDPYFYARSGNPNFSDVEELCAGLDRAPFAVLFASGMAAVDAVLARLGPGGRLVSHRLVYGCSYRFLSDACARLGVELEFADLSDAAARRAALARRADMVFFETPTNPFLRSVDIRAAAREAKAANPDCLVVVDNTWATPLFQRPIEHGADIALYSCSKFLSGHSDLILGLACAKDAGAAEALRKRRFYGGAVPDPFAAWLLRRSLQTLAVRLRAHSENTAAAARFLRAQRKVAEVFLPKVDGRQLTGYAGMVFFRFRGDSAGRKADRFASSLRLFDRGTPLATVSSAVAIPYTGSHASMTPQEKASVGLGPDLIRLSLGIESAADLVADLKRAFAKI